MPETTTSADTAAVQTIDMTPTWGEWGNIYARFAETGETRVVKGLHRDFARAMAACQAFNTIRASLTPEQLAIAKETIAIELAKQGESEQEKAPDAVATGDAA